MVGAGIAFSVYLDHDLDLGAPEVLKYNKVGMKELNNTQILTSSNTNIIYKIFSKKWCVNRNDNEQPKQK